jgi:hypothetical protein
MHPATRAGLRKVERETLETLTAEFEPTGGEAHFARKALVF